MTHDLSLDALLDRHGQVLVIDEAGYWVRFVVHRVPATAARPHGLNYSLTLHDPDGEQLMGFDNAHAVAGARAAAFDHRHRLAGVRPCEYRSAAGLVTHFWAAMESVMRDRGVWS